MCVVCGGMRGDAIQTRLGVPVNKTLVVATTACLWMKFTRGEGGTPVPPVPPLRLHATRTASPWGSPPYCRRSTAGGCRRCHRHRHCLGRLGWSSGGSPSRWVSAVRGWGGSRGWRSAAVGERVGCRCRGHDCTTGYGGGAGWRGRGGGGVGGTAGQARAVL